MVVRNIVNLWFSTFYSSPPNKVQCIELRTRILPSFISSKAHSAVATVVNTKDGLERKNLGEYMCLCIILETRRLHVNQCCHISTRIQDGGQLNSSYKNILQNMTITRRI